MNEDTTLQLGFLRASDRLIIPKITYWVAGRHYLYQRPWTPKRGNTLNNHSDTSRSKMADVKSLDFQHRCTWQLFTADLVSAALAAALVSPWVKAIDAYVS